MIYLLTAISKICLFVIPNHSWKLHDTNIQVLEYDAFERETLHFDCTIYVLNSNIEILI